MASQNRSFLPTLFLLIFSLTTVSYGAIKKEPQPIDTVSFNGKQIILYANNSWQYLQFTKTDSIADEELNEDYTDADSVFNSNWITGQVFAYKTKKAF
jgi:hypothetical protein